MGRLYAVVGGSGLYELGDGFEIEQALLVDTPYGKTSAKLQVGRWQGAKVAFLPRHGTDHKIPPHKINYRANIWALNSVGVTDVIAVNAVGGISQDYSPDTLGVPNQIIDYSHGREHSYCDGTGDQVGHVDFTRPYSSNLRNQIMSAASASEIAIVDGGTYGCSNGPRLETAAEIRKMKADGCDLIGMTGMPEAALARELQLDYASIAIVVNRCAGLSDELISMDQMMHHLQQGIGKVRALILETLHQVKL